MIRQTMLYRARRRARKKSIPFSITLADIPSVPNYCPVLGIELRKSEDGSPCDASPSLDRIIPARGYVPGNLRIISNRANKLRNNSNAEELLKIVRDARNLETIDSQRVNLGMSDTIQ